MASKEREEAIDKLLEAAKGTQAGPADQATQPVTYLEAMSRGQAQTDSARQTTRPESAHKTSPSTMFQWGFFVTLGIIAAGFIPWIILALIVAAIAS